jgi:hypothetical protein
MLEFINEIAESRMFRNADGLKNKSAEEIAKIAFLTVMMLEVLRTIDSTVAKNYAQKTLPFQNFQGMRTSATDLHNLLVALANQDEYEGKIKANHNINVPGLQFKRYLRDVDNGYKNIPMDRNFFLELERFFKLSDSNLKTIRRHVMDWHRTSDSEKIVVVRNIKQMANSLSQQNDLYQTFRTKTS